MAGKIRVLSQTGQTLYSHVRNVIDLIWNTNTLAFESFNSAHWAQYVIPLTEQAPSGYYSAAFPVLITTPGLYFQQIYLQVGGSGGSPSATNDQPVGSGDRIWDGVEEESGWSTPSRGITGSVDIASITGNPTAAGNLSASGDTIIVGTVVNDISNSNSSFVTNLGFTLTGLFVNRVVFFRTGALKGQASAIVSYDGSFKKLTVNPMVGQPAAGDSFVIG